MRIGVLASLVICHVFRAAVAADEAFPYIVHVASDKAPLRSGPGEDYYETSAVVRGTPVEVWRHAPGGWLGIRPPKGSFSLVPASDVRLAPDRLAVAVRPETPARIGSELTSERDVVQVLLEESETVRVLETITLDGQFWHRIAPPAGEFRWIHADGVSGATPPADAAVAETFLPVQNAPAPYRIARYSTAAGGQVAPSAAPAAEDSAETLADVIERSPGGQADDAQITLADLEVELATIVAEDSRLWQFAHLRKRCQEQLASSDAARQSKLEEILEKIGRFEEIRDKKRAVQLPVHVEALAGEASSTAAAAPRVEDAATPGGRETSSSALRESSSAAQSSVTWRAAREPGQQRTTFASDDQHEAVRIPDSAPAPADETDRYDGIGTLRPVVSRRPEAPRYALVDSEGDVVTFITPSTGVNLQPYIGQRIGVVGTRGYMPEFKRAHVTAARVAPLR
jgi:hypothetical protein